MPRLLLIIVLVLIASAMYAQFAGGSGTESDPWLVETRLQLEQLNNYLGVGHTDKYYRQIADIDLGASPWNPIGRVTPFYGQYDGDGYNISNLNISDYLSGPSGLFAKITNSDIKNVYLNQVSLTLSYDSYPSFQSPEAIASLVGYVTNSVIDNCHANGQIILNFQNTGAQQVGGLVSVLDVNSSLINSSSHCSIEIYSWTYLYEHYILIHNIGGLVADNKGTIHRSQFSNYVYTTVYNNSTPDGGESSYVGGITGYNQGLISESFSSGSVYGNWYIGGLVGWNSGNITKSFSTSSVNASDNFGGLAGVNYSSVYDSYARGDIFGNEFGPWGIGVNGGFVGSDSWNSAAVITNGYSTGTYDDNVNYGPNSYGFIGGPNGTLNDCYYDIERWYYAWENGPAMLRDADARSTASMTYPYQDEYQEDLETYVNWDFDNIWEHDYNHDINDGYPYLRWQASAPYAYFRADAAPDVAPLTMRFKDMSRSFIPGDLSYLWDFGDGITSTQTNPIHTFLTSGLHTVSLTVSNVFDSTATFTREVFVPSNIADFTASITSGYLPLSVQFTDVTPLNVTEWQWDFDDDGVIDSYEQNPIWTYIFPGSYTVTMNISTADASYTETKETLINVGLDPSLTKYVPTQYSTIQAAINAANNGDYIIVADGTYFENLLIEGKSITLASYFFIDGDSTHIANTIIDGSNALNPDQASTLTILPGSGRPETKPHVIGFTIRNGSGRRIIQNVGGTIVEKRVGGGIYIRQSEPVFSYNKIVDNDADDEGGGSYAFYSVPNLGGMVNPSIGLFNPGMNQFRNNTADIGADIYIDGILRRDPVKIGNCSFEVMSVADTTVSNYWVSSSSSVDFTGSSGRNAAITTDIYVATNGNDLTNTGTSPSSPFKTIDHALSRIYASAENPLTIHLASGTYSPSLTGEKYPLQMVKYASLQGAGIEESFLDAEASADFPRRVLNLDKVEGVNISDLTIMNGFVTMVKNYNGGGIGLINSQANLQNILIAGNSSAGNGSGIYALGSELIATNLSLDYNASLGSGGGMHSMQSDLQLSQSRILNNSASRNGAGLSIDGGSVSIEGCELSANQATGYQSKGGGISLVNTEAATISANLIKANNADLGGGLYLQNNSNIHFDRNKIINNLADFNGGAAFINTTTGLLTNNLLANNTASQRGGAIYCYSSPELINNTIANNKAALQGGGLYLNGSSPLHLNSILWGNVQGATSLPNQVYLFGEDSDPQFRYCLIEGGSAGFGLSPGISYTGIYEHNLSGDPGFAEPSAGAGYYFEVGEASFTLHDDSPCLDSGDPDTDPEFYPTDLAGNPRVDNGRIDMGAYEKQHFTGPRISADPAIVDFGRVNINGSPATLELVISNTGNQELTISSIALESLSATFGIETEQRTQLIAPGASITILLSFAPATVGQFSTNLTLISNALNQPELTIPLTGYGIDASTSYPSNVQLQIIGNHVHLSWNPVLSDPLGDPFTPAGYVVLYSENADVVIDNYFFLALCEETQHVHYDVARFRNKMFYSIVAIDQQTRNTLQSRGWQDSSLIDLTWQTIKELLGTRD